MNTWEVAITVFAAVLVISILITIGYVTGWQHCIGQGAT